MKTKKYVFFLLKVAIYVIVFLTVIVSANYFIDASSIINPKHSEMAKLALEGNIVAVPPNYNERAYQVCIVEQMEKPPETIVIGSSRGMFLGSEITGYHNLYNNCVSSACLEDNYALLGLYYTKFGKLPSRIIIETGPWIFYEDNPETSWIEMGTYTDSATDLYKIINDEEISADAKTENPYLSLSYFQYNIEQLLHQLIKNGVSVFDKTKEARISMDVNEAADYPDGSFRYNASLENESEKRLKGVQQTRGACTYENVHVMTNISAEKAKGYENLIDYLLQNNCEVIIYMQPFSVTQCEYSFDQGLNPVFTLVENYLKELSVEKEIKLVGGYDARDFGLTDERFIDFMHLDKIGTNIVWNY